MTPRRIVLAAALAMAAWLAMFGDTTPSRGIAEPIARASASIASRPASNNSSGSTAPVGASALFFQPVAANHAGKAERETMILALRTRGEFIGGAVSAKHGDDLFASQSWMPPPPPPAKPMPSPPPGAPPLPFTYIGKKIEDAVWEVYLARGDQTLIVREQTTIDGIYRVESIAPPSLVLVYLPLNKMQTLLIGGAD